MWNIIMKPSIISACEMCIRDRNYTATTMLANSEFVALLKQANTDSSKMAEVIGVSEAQLRFEMCIRDRTGYNVPMRN